MKHEAEQFELELPAGDPLQRQWDENARAQAAYWGPDASVIYWWAAGSWDKEGWEALPEYERRRWRNMYDLHRSRSLVTGGRMPTAADALASLDEMARHDREIAESWAAEIRKAFLERRPCPIIPEPRFRYLLDWALQLAQVPEGCLEAAVSE